MSCLPSLIHRQPKRDHFWQTYSSTAFFLTRVYVRVDDSNEQPLDYSGGFWGRKKADGPVIIAIRGTPEDETGDGYLYEGSIAHLLVDNR